MKRSYLCFGVLSALFTIFGLSLSVYSVDTSALKYSFDTFPLYRSSFSEYNSFSGENFGFWFDGSSSHVFSEYLFDYDDTYYYSRFPSSSGCVDSIDKSRIFASTAVPSDSYTSFYSGEGTGFVRSFDSDSSDCYGSTSFSYDSFYGNLYNISNGEVESVVDINRALFDDSSNVVRSLKRATIPLNFDPEFSFPANTPLSFSFGFVTSSPTGFSDFSSPSISFSSIYVSDGVVYSDELSSYCSINDNYGFGTVNDDLSVTGVYQGFLVTCNVTFPRSISKFTSRLILSGGSSPFLTYSSNYGLYFSASYLITDNDSTWSGMSISPKPSGEKLSSAPGYVQLYGVDSPVCYPGDFLCQLQNLFSFNFINPFQPLFDLFSSNDSCVQIPTIAGMIHSEESQICPWFDSSVRSIVTPVLGLASIMLVFGFAVRWLSGSSGNMFVDDDVKDTGYSFSLRNKYGRK